MAREQSASRGVRRHCLGRERQEISTAAMATNQAITKALVLMLLFTATNATFHEETHKAAPYTPFAAPSYSYNSYTPFAAPSIKPYAIMLPPIDLAGFTPGQGSSGPAIGAYNFGGQNIGGLAGYSHGGFGGNKIVGFAGHNFGGFGGHNIGSFGGQSFSNFGEQHMVMGLSSPTFGGNKAFNVANLQPNYNTFGSQGGVPTPAFQPDAWSAASSAHDPAVSGYASGVLFSQQARSAEPHHGFKIFKKIVTTDSADTPPTTVLHGPVSLQPVAVPVHYYNPPDTFVRPPSRLEKIKEFVIEKGYTGGHHHGQHGGAKIQKVIELDFSRANQGNSVVIQQAPSQFFVPASHHVYKRSLQSASSKTSIQDISSSEATEKKARDKRLIPVLPPPLLIRPRPMLRPVRIIREPLNIYRPGMYNRPFIPFAPRPILRQYRPMYPQMIFRRPPATPLYARPRRVFNVRTFYPSRIIGSQYRPPRVVTVTRYRRSVDDTLLNQNITSSTSSPTRGNVTSGTSDDQPSDLKPQSHLHSFKRPPPIMLNFLSNSSLMEHNNDGDERAKNLLTTLTPPEEKYEGAKNESASGDKQAKLQHQLHPNMHKLSLRPPLHNTSLNQFELPPVSKFPHRHPPQPSFQPSLNWQQAYNPALARFAVPMTNYYTQQAVYMPPTRLIPVRTYTRLYMNQPSSEWSNATPQSTPYHPIASPSSSALIPTASPTTYVSNQPVEHPYAVYPALLPARSHGYRLRYMNT